MRCAYCGRLQTAVAASEPGCKEQNIRSVQRWWNEVREEMPDKRVKTGAESCRPVRAQVCRLASDMTAFQML